MPHMMDESDVVKEVGLRPVGQVAEFLCLSRSKVYALMDSGQLPYVKFGKSRRVRWSDVLKLVEDNLISRGSD